MPPDAALEGRLLNLLQVLDWDLHNHVDELILLLRRIPGFPGATELVTTAVAYGFRPSTEYSQLRHTPRERDLYMRSVQRAVCSIISGLLSSDQSAWPGSTGCAALLLSLESIKGTILKRALELQAILSPTLSLETVPNGIPNYLYQCLELRLVLAKKILLLVDVDCVTLILPVCSMFCEVRVLVSEKRQSLDVLVPSPSLKTSITTPKRIRTMHLKPHDFWQPPPVTSKGWEDLIFAIEEVNIDLDEDEDGALWAKIRWKVKDKRGNMQLSKNPIAHLHMAAPQMLLEYYQKHVVLVEKDFTSKGARGMAKASTSGTLRKS